MFKQLGLIRAHQKLQRSLRHTLPGVGMLAAGAALLVLLVPPASHPKSLSVKKGQSLSHQQSTSQPKTATSNPTTQQTQTTPTPSKPQVSVPVVKTTPGSSVGNLEPASSPPAQGSGAANPPSGSSTPAPFQAAPETYTSDNWAGYFVVKGSYSAVSANWVVPEPEPSSPEPSADTTWIGIGGILSGDLIQVGTFNTISASGRLSTLAFYEMLPGSSISIPSLSVSPGDNMSAALTETSADIWSVSITDNTTDQSFNTTVSYNSTNSSVEWIQEDPSNTSGQPLPLDEFGNVPFSACLAVSGGDALTLTQLSADNVTMINNSDQVVGAPSILGSDGASFSVEWE